MNYRRIIYLPLEVWLLSLVFSCQNSAYFPGAKVNVPTTSDSLDCLCKVIVNKNKTLNIRKTPRATGLYLETLHPGELVLASCFTDNGFRFVSDVKRTHVSGYSTASYLICSTKDESSKNGFDILWSEEIPSLNINGIERKFRPGDFANLIFVVKNILPRLPGAYEDKIKKVAQVTWWSMKEGVFPHQEYWMYRYSNCQTDSGDSSDYNDPIRDCPKLRNSKNELVNPAWQVGLGAAQVFNATSPEKIFSSLFPGKDISTHLEEMLRAAQFKESDITQIVGTILQSESLKRGWLARDPLISFELANIEVEGECLDPKNVRPYCYNESQVYAPDKESILPTIEQIAAIFRKYYPIENTE